MPSPKLLLSNYALRIIKKSSPTPTAQCTGAQHLPSPITHQPLPIPIHSCIHAGGQSFSTLRLLFGKAIRNGNYKQRCVCLVVHSKLLPFDRSVCRAVGRSFGCRTVGKLVSTCRIAHISSQTYADLMFLFSISAMLQLELKLVACS